MSRSSESALRPATRGALIALLSLALGAGLLAGQPTAQAVSPDDWVTTPLAVGPQETKILAAIGNYFVARGLDSTTKISSDNGKNWADVKVDEVNPANYVGIDTGGKNLAIWHSGKKVTALDLSDKKIDEYIFEEEVLAVNSKQAVTKGSGDPLLQSLTSPRTSTRIHLDLELKLPKKVVNSEKLFVLGEGDLLAEITEHYNKAGQRFYSDVDLAEFSGFTSHAPFRIAGDVQYIGFGGVAGNDLEYVVRASTKINQCVLAPTAKKPVCKTIAKVKKKDDVVITRSLNSYGLLINTTLKVYETATKKLVTVNTKQTSDESFVAAGPTSRPIIRATIGYISRFFAEQIDGSFIPTQLFQDFDGPLRPTSLELNAVTVAGTDLRAGPTGWTREYLLSTDFIGAEGELTASNQLQLSGSRIFYGTAAGVLKTDGGAQNGTVKSITTLHDLSGPYALVTKSKKQSVLLNTGSTYGSRVAAIFGPRALELNSAKTGGTVIDVTKPTKPKNANLVATLPKTAELAPWKIREAFMWGDYVVAGMTYGGHSLTQVFDLNGKSLGAHCQDSYPVAMSDGLVVIYLIDNQQFKPWNFLNTKCTDSVGEGMTLKDADTNVIPALYGSKIAYSTGTDLKIADLSALEGVAKNGPRLLYRAVPGTYNVNGVYWSADFDTTSALEAGTITIKNASGVVVRTIATFPSADGSIRGFDSEYAPGQRADLTAPSKRGGWDGSSSNTPSDPDPVGNGKIVPNGVYTWTFKALSAENGKPLTSLDGRTENITGSITVTNVPLPDIKPATPTISITKPKVGQTLTANPGAWSPGGINFTYQWYRGTVAISAAEGGQASTYTVTDLDYKKKLKVSVTGSCPGRPTGLPKACTGYQKTFTKTSKVTKAVAKGTFTAQVPTLSIVAPAAPKVGTSITVVSLDPSKWHALAVFKPASFDYQWYRVDKKGKAKAISGALGKASSYTPVAKDVNYRLRVKVTGKRANFTSASSTSANSLAIVP